MNESIIRNMTAHEIEREFHGFNSEQLGWAVRRLLILEKWSRMEIDEKNHEIKMLGDCDSEKAEMEDKLERIMDILNE